MLGTTSVTGSTSPITASDPIVPRFEDKNWSSMACWLTPVLILVLIAVLLVGLYSFVWNNPCQCGKRRRRSRTSYASDHDNNDNDSDNDSDKDSDKDSDNNNSNEHMSVRIAGGSSPLPKSGLITGKDLRHMMNNRPSTTFVVGFFSKRCGHCIQMKPAYEQVMKQSPHVYSLFLDGDEEAIKIGTELGIEGYPTIYSFKNGQKANEFDPAKPRTVENLLQFVRQG